jgi:hypothetical protein
MVHTIKVDAVAESDFGQDCSDNNNKVAIVGATTNWFTILHEIGHMLALDDVRETASQWGSDPDENFMRHVSDSRKFFTEGQIFRMHFGWGSAINVFLNKHPSETRACDSSPALPCPKLNERVWPDH